MKASPLPHYPEHTCYAVAREMMSKLKTRRGRAATDNFLAGHISKPVHLQPHEVRIIARFYYRTFYVEPFGEKTRIALR